MNNKKQNKAVFLDRDGVINHVVFHSEVNKPSSPWKIEEFKIIEDISDPIEELKKMGFLLFIISNQPDIARGKIIPSTTDEINKIILSKFPIDEIVVCPHDDSDNCNCRKPKPGMIIDLSKKWNVNLEKSYLIGDSWKDIGAGKSAKIKSILIEKKYNRDVDAEYRAADLKSAVELIRKQQ